MSRYGSWSDRRTSRPAARRRASRSLRRSRCSRTSLRTPPDRTPRSRRRHVAARLDLRAGTRRQLKSTPSYPGSRTSKLPKTTEPLRPRPPGGGRGERQRPRPFRRSVTTSAAAAAMAVAGMKSQMSGDSVGASDICVSVVGAASGSTDVRMNDVWQIRIPCSVVGTSSGSSLALVTNTSARSRRRTDRHAHPAAVEARERLLELGRHRDRKERADRPGFRVDSGAGGQRVGARDEPGRLDREVLNTTQTLWPADESRQIDILARPTVRGPLREDPVQRAELLGQRARRFRHRPRSCRRAFPVAGRRRSQPQKLGQLSWIVPVKAIARTTLAAAPSLLGWRVAVERDAPGHVRSIVVTLVLRPAEPGGSPRRHATGTRNRSSCCGTDEREPGTTSRNVVEAGRAPGELELAPVRSLIRRLQRDHHCRSQPVAPTKPSGATPCSGLTSAGASPRCLLPPPRGRPSGSGRSCRGSRRGRASRRRFSTS